MILLRLGYEISILIGLCLLLTVVRENRSTPGRISFSLLAISSMLWSGAELLLLQGWISEVASDRMQYLGALAMPALWIGFAAQASGVEIAKRVPWFSAIFMLPSVCFYPMLYSSRWGSLFVTTVEGGANLHGPLWSFWAAYAQLLAIAGALLLAVTGFYSPHRRQRVQRFVLALAPLLPLAGNSLYQSFGEPWIMDPTPIMIGLGLLTLRGAAFSGGAMPVLPISQHELLHQLPFGVLLTNRFGMVVEVNDAASNRLGTTESDVVGRSLGSVLADTGVAPIRSAPLRVWGRIEGEIVLV